MIDPTAFHCLSYGLYLISSKAEGQSAGCVANTFQQVTSSPLQVSVALNKDNATTDVVRASQRFVATCLSEDASMELIGTFGFHCSLDRDKFAACTVSHDGAGLPYVVEHACSRFSVRVVQEVDLGTHILFVGEVEEAERLDVQDPMTYAYYHQVKGGKTPPKASSYLPENISVNNESEDAPRPKIAWYCTVCGHVEYLDELPGDYACPVCGVEKDLFKQVEK